MGKLESIRLNEYAIKGKLWPNYPEADDVLLALWCFLKEKEDFFGLSLREIDYFFRDEPKKTWINEDELQRLIVKAQLLELKNLSSLNLITRIKLIELYLKDSNIEAQLIFAGHEELVFDIRNLDQKQKLKETFPSIQLKFLGEENG